MYRNIRLALLFLMTAAVSVGLSVFVFLHYFYKPVVVLDLKELVAHQRQKAMSLETDKAVEEIGKYFDELSRELSSRRREIVLVKDAVLNPEQVPDITDEFKK